MQSIQARDLLDQPKDALWQMKDGWFELVFDDGTLVTETRRTIYCYYLWNIHRHYRQLPLLCCHHLGDQRISSSQHIQLLSKIYEDWYHVYHDEPHANKEDVWRLIYETVNWIYNDFICQLDRYVATASAIDFLDAIDEPQIHQANDEVKPTQKSIDQTYDVIQERLHNSDQLNRNGIAMAVRSSMVDMKQVQQCLGPRGFVTEIDSTIFKNPIAVGFAHGLRSIHDVLIESRSASKALLFAKDPLQECEYFNRKLQFVGQIVRHLVPGDCGSPHTIPWTLHSSELSTIDGTHYMVGDEVRTIREYNTDLIGETLQIRTPFGCIAEDRQSVCEVCCGRISQNIPYYTNLGNQAAISLGELISQLVLSTKHVEGSSKVDEIDLGETYSQYLIPGAEDNTLRLSPQLKGLPVRIVIKADEAPSLPDVYHIKNFEEIDVTKISEMREVKMWIGRDDDPGGVHEMTVPISLGSRLGSLTRKALHYISQRDLEIDDKGHYIIDLCHFDTDETLFELPLKHLNMLEFQQQVERMILSVKNDRARLVDFKEPVGALKALTGLINSKKLPINFGYIMLIAYAATARDPKNYDFRLPRGGESFQFIPMRMMMTYRSMGVKMAYERQELETLFPETYVIKQRLYHPLDAMIKGCE